MAYSLFALLGFFGTAHGWFLPGVAPHHFARGERVELKVNKLTSTQTQVPFDYYSLPFCKPEGGVVVAAENLGEFLTGDRIENSPYKIYMRDEMHCEVLCQKLLGSHDLTKLELAVEHDYHHNWIIDNLPVASVVTHSFSRTSQSPDFQPESTVETSYTKGFPVGFRVVEMSVREPSAATQAAAGEGSTAKAAAAPQVTLQSVDYYLYNHVDIKVLYHCPPDEATNPKAPDRNRVVGVFATPRSVKHRFVNGLHWTPTVKDPETGEAVAQPPPQLATCSAARFSDGPGTSAVDPNAEFQRIEAGTTLYTYGVQWERSEVRWASRWDVYLAIQTPSQVHWFAIVNSLMIVLALSAVVGIILIKAVNGDIARYNSERPDDVVPLTEAEKDEERADSGWKLAHRRVFATPPHPVLLASLVGTGVQLLGSAITTVFFGAVGYLSPASRGSFFVAALCFFCVFAGAGGYVAGRMHRTLTSPTLLTGTSGASTTKGSFDAPLSISSSSPGAGFVRRVSQLLRVPWVPPGLLVAMGFPGLAFTGFAAANLALHAAGSSAAVPVHAAIALAFLWLAVAAPLAFLGAACGHGRPPIEYPVPVDPFPRPIPDKPWMLGWGPCFLVGGALPFGACYAELFFVLSSLWTDSYYYLFGFLFLALLLLALTCALVAVLLTYLLLCAEDPRWGWRSFGCAAATGAYVLAYSAVFFSRLEANQTLTYALYFGYMSLGCVGIALMCGAVGFAASFMFVLTIYDSIKVD